MLSMDVLCSTAQQWALACIRRLRRVESTPVKHGFFTYFSCGGCSTSELFNTQATLAKLFVRGASRAVASRVGWSVVKKQWQVLALLAATRYGIHSWRWRGRGHCCGVNHDYENKQLMEAPRGGARGSAPPARARARAGAASWCGSGVPPGAALGRRPLSRGAHAGRAAVAVVVERYPRVPHIFRRGQIEHRFSRPER